VKDRFRTVSTLSSFLATLVIFIGLPASGAAGIIYNVDRVVDIGRITGTIETNGTIGVLSVLDILDWDLVIDADGIPATTGQLLGPLSGNNSSTFLEGGPLTATPAGLFFDFSIPLLAILQITTPTFDVVWQLQGEIPFHDELIREAIFPDAIQAFVVHERIIQQVATAAAVGEPATLTLLVLGIAGLCFGRRRRA
jgi:hypothetical protein